MNWNARKREVLEGLDYEDGEFDMFDLITSAYYGKRYYFLQDDGLVYSRESHKCMTFDNAVDDF